MALALSADPPPRRGGPVEGQEISCRCAAARFGVASHRRRSSGCSNGAARAAFSRGRVAATSARISSRLMPPPPDLLAGRTARPTSRSPRSWCTSETHPERCTLIVAPRAHVARARATPWARLQKKKTARTPPSRSGMTSGGDSAICSRLGGDRPRPGTPKGPGVQPHPQGARRRASPRRPRPLDQDHAGRYGEPAATPPKARLGRGGRTARPLGNRTPNPTRRARATGPGPPADRRTVDPRGGARR